MFKSINNQNDSNKKPQENPPKKIIVLTGDRPTGPLHLGHYVGSLINRLILQENPKYSPYIMVADVQALTDNYNNPEKVRQNVFEVALDYLSVGINPDKTNIFIQSCIPEIAELTIFYLNLVTVNRLKRNPTVKAEIKQKKFGDKIPAGFFIYPVSQAADITIVKGQLIPVGEDQIPMIEQANEIVRSFNRIYKTDVLVESKPLVSHVTRLVGIDGQSKMSKSLGNAIYLSDSIDIIAKKVKSMYTDPNHIKITDPGTVEGNTVFSYLDAFDNNKQEVEKLKEQYRLGGLGDIILKNRLIEIIENLLKPIQEKRKELIENPEYINQVLKDGTEKVRTIAEQTLTEVKEAMHINYFK